VFIIPGNYDLGTAKGVIELDASSLGRASAALRATGLAFTAVGIAAVAAFGYAVAKAATFEQVMSGAQSALCVTNKQMEIVKKTALDLGANSIYGATNVARAIESLAFAGLTVQEIVGGAAKATIDLAQASGGLISLDEAGRTVANTMRTFGLSAKDATHIANELAGAANKSTIDIGDMVTSFRYVGPVAHTAGLGIDDMAVALAMLGDRGIRGSTAGTSLRGVLLGLVNPSDKARGVLEDLGIVTAEGANIMFDASGKMKSFAEVAQILQDHTKSLTREQKIAAFGTIFQRRALASALVLAEQGAKGFKHYQDVIAAGGTASQIAATRLDNLKGDVAKLKSQLETTVIKAGTPFQNMLRAIVQHATSLIKAFGSLSPRTQTLLLAFLGIGGAIFIMLGAVALFLSALIKMYRVFRDLQLALKVVITLFQGLDAALAANPIVLIVLAVLAVIAVLVLLYLNWNKVWNWISHHKAIALIIAIIAPFLASLVAIVAVIKFVQANWRRIWEDIQSVFYTVVATIQSAWSSVAAFFASVWSSISDAFSVGWAKIQPILNAIGGFFASLVGPITDFVNAALRQLGLFNDWFQHNAMPTIKAFGDLFAAIWHRISQSVDVAWKVIFPILKLFGIAFKTELNVAISTLRFFGQVVAAVFGLVRDWIIVLANIMKAVWEPVWKAMLLVVNVALTEIQGIFSVFIGVVLAVWTPFWHLLRDVVMAVWQVIKEVIDAALLFIRGIIEVATGLISGKWGKVWKGIKDIFAGVWDNIVAIVRFSFNILKAIVLNGIDAVIGFLRNVPGRAATAMGNLLKVLVNRGKDLIQGFWNGIITVVSLVMQYFLKLPGVFLGLLSDAEHWLFDIGTKIIKGLLDGIKSAMGSVKDFVTSIPGKLISWKGPPAKDKILLVDNGSLIMQGLVTGFKKSLPAVQAFLKDTGTMIENFQPTVRARIAATGGVGLGLTGAGASQPSGDSYAFSFTFGDNTTSETVAQAKSTLTSAEILQEITKAVRAGKR